MELGGPGCPGWGAGGLGVLRLGLPFALPHSVEALGILKETFLGGREHSFMIMIPGVYTASLLLRAQIACTAVRAPRIPEVQAEGEGHSDFEMEAP